MAIKLRGQWAGRRDKCPACCASDAQCAAGQIVHTSSVGTCHLI
jgi:hypothetical protein